MPRSSSNITIVFETPLSIYRHSIYCNIDCRFGNPKFYGNLKFPKLKFWIFEVQLPEEGKY